MLWASDFSSKSCLYLQEPIVALFRVCSKSVSVFHRCIPVDVACYAEFAQELVTFVSDNNVFRRVIAGVMASKEIIMGLCLLALGMAHGLIWFTVVFVCLKMYLYFPSEFSRFLCHEEIHACVNILMRILSLK